jgi:hypothetical protein
MKIIALPYDYADKEEYEQYDNTPWVWLDGYLAKINGYDLCYVEDVPEQDGIYECEVDIEGKLYQARLYIWWGEGSEMKRRLGFVCAINDNRSNAWAQIKYDTKSYHGNMTQEEADILAKKGF